MRPLLQERARVTGTARRAGRVLLGRMWQRLRGALVRTRTAQHASELSASALMPSGSGYGLTLSSDKAVWQAGDTATLTATASGLAAGCCNSILFYRTDGTSVQGCDVSSAAPSCSITVRYALQPQSFVAYLVSPYGGYGGPPPPNTVATSNTVTISPTPWSVTLTSSATQLRTNQQATLTALANQNAGLAGVYVIIYNQTSGTRLVACGGPGQSASSCAVAVGWPGNTPQTYIAYVSSGAEATAPPSGIIATSGTVTVSRAPIVVTLTSDTSVTTAGYYAHLSAYADQPLSGFALEIFDVTTGLREDNCGGVSPCDTWVGVWSGTPHQFVAEVGQYGNTEPLAQLLAKSGTVGVGPAAWTADLSFDPSAQSLTATTNQQPGPAGLYLEIFNADTGAEFANCGTSTHCTYTLAGAATNYVAVIGGFATQLYPDSQAVAYSGVVYAPTGGPGAAGETTGGSNPAENTQCQSCAGDPVNTATGEFSETVADIVDRGRGPALSVARTYSSRIATRAGALGPGWSLNGQSFLRSTAGGSQGCYPDGVQRNAGITYITSIPAFRMPAATGPLVTGVQSIGAQFQQPASTQLEANRTNAIECSSSGAKFTVQITQENGSTLDFTSDVTGNTFTATRARENATLVHHADGSWTLTRRHRDVFNFNAMGWLSGVADLNGNTITYTYDNTTGQLLSAADTSGRTLSYTYAGTPARLDHVTGPDGQTVTYHYDASGQLTSVTDVAGNATGYGYDSQHLLTTVTDPRLHSVINHYDSHGRVDQQTDRANRITSFTYNGDGSTTIGEPNGSTMIDRYSNLELASETRAAGTPLAATWQYTYDPATLGRSLVTDPLGHHWAASYDADGNVLTSTDPLNRHTVATYNGLDEPLTVTDPAGVTTTNTYDANGNLLSTSTPLSGPGSDAAHTALTTFHHDDAGHPGDVTSVTDPNGKTWTYGHDTYGDINSVRDPLNHTTSTMYNAEGWPTQVTDARTKQTNLTYWPNGLLKTRTDALNQQTGYVYDGDGNLTDVTDPAGRHTQYAYNADDQPTTETRADLSTVSTGYDSAGRMLTQTDGANKSTSYGYNALDQITSVTDPLSRSTSYAYDTAGNLVTVTEPSGVTITRAYDIANELTGITYSDSTPNVTAVGYDPDGRRTSMTDGTGTSTWTYDALGRLTEQKNGAGADTKYAYDLAGDQSAITYPDGTVIGRGFDDARMQTSLTDGLAAPSSYGYDATNNLTSAGQGNGASTVTTVDDTGVPSGSATTAPGGATLASFGATRNPDAQVLTSTTTGAVSGTDTYTYNPLAQLTSTASTTSPSGSTGYDSADNPTSFPDATQQSYDVANELTSSSRISVVGNGAGGSNGTATSATVSLPGGVQAGDLIVLAVTVGGSTTPTVSPAGYTPLPVSQTGSTAADTKTLAFTKVAGNGEASPSVSVGSLPAAFSAALVVYRGVKTISANGVDVSGPNHTNGTSLTLPMLTPTVSGERLLTVVGATGNATAASWTAPTGMRDVAHQSSNALSSLAIADQQLITTAATGTRTASFGSSVATNLAGIDLTLIPVLTTHGYDSNGDRTSVTPPSGTATTLGYDAEQRLTSVSGPTTASYHYDGTGLRTSKTAGTNTDAFTWDTSSGLPRLLADNGTDFVYGPDGLPTEQITARPTITNIGTGQNSTPAAAQPLTVPMPSGVRAGDLIVLTSTQSAGDTVTPPAGGGYNQLANVTGNPPTNPALKAANLVVFTRIATGNDPSPALTYSQPLGASAAISVYRGIDTTNPIDIVSGTSSPSGGTGNLVGLPSHTTVLHNDMLIGIAGQTGNALTSTWSIGSGIGSRVQATGNALSSLVLGDANLTNPGLTASPNATASQSGQLVALTLSLAQAPTVLYYTHDQQGSTSLLTDGKGRVRATYTYTPAGQLLSHTGDQNTPLQYTGEYTDTETGYQYLRARYYDPATAQFLTRDPADALTRDAYGYAGNDPVNGSDPSGLCSLFSFGDNGCLAAAAAAVPGGQTLDDALTGAVSFGDQVTFGASHWLRHEVGLGGAVDECSSAYNNQAVGLMATVFMFADGEGEAAAARQVLRFTEDQGALVALAKVAKRTGVNLGDAETLLKWADEVGLPARGPEVHPGRPTVNFPHIHIGPVGHIPVIL